MKKTIIFSPIRQDAGILSLVLNSLETLESYGELEIWVYDDNDEPESKNLLLAFERSHSNVKILPKIDLPDTTYHKDDDKHHWDDRALEKVTLIKNRAIELFLASQSDEIFFVDSDLILHPKILLQLQSVNVSIVSEVFWTKYAKEKDYHPNVWDCHFYKFWSADRMIRLKNPGLYDVGGLGACTLIQREPLEKGVNFSLVENIDFWGEDRHFCTRAMCLGYRLYVDTHYPPFHVYRENMLEEATTWAKNGYQPDYFDNWLNAEWENKIKKSFLPKNRRIIPRILRRIAFMLDK